MRAFFNRQNVFMKSLSVWSTFAVVVTTSMPAFAAGTAVLGGSANLQNLTRVTMDKNDANAAVFSSTAASGVLDWTKFNVGNGQSMTFNGVSTTFFNLVDGVAGKSQIDGIINGSGNVWVINPSGIAFGAHASIDVGGLFAAAAGNIANAEALRNGTEMMPTFSSLAGTVSSASGATFAADQVALLGKTVEAAGDMTGVNALTVGAAGLLVVDDVGGGRVSVNLAAFADNAAEDGAILGDLQLGDTASGLLGGDLEVMSDRGIKIEGDVTVGGKASVYNIEGDITVAKDASLKSVSQNLADVNLTTAVFPGTEAHGDIVINGTVSADETFGLGSVNVVAGQGEGNSGSVVLNGTVSADYYAQLGTRTGDVTVNGSLESGTEATASTHDGTITVGDAGRVVGRGDYEDYGLYGMVNLHAAMDAGSQGDVVVRGTIEAGGAYGTVTATAGYNVVDPTLLGGSGKVDLSGHIGAAYGITAYGDSVSIVNDGDISILDAIATKGDVNIMALAGSISVWDAVDASDSLLMLAGYDFESRGNILLYGDVSVGKDAELYSGYAQGYGFGGGALGQISVDGNLTVGGALTASAATGIGGEGSITTGSTLIMDGGGRGVEFTGVVKAGGDAGFYGADYQAYDAMGNVRLENEANQFNGVVLAEGKEVSITSSKDIVLGDVNAVNGRVAVRSKDGSVTVKEDARITAFGEEGEVVLTAAQNAGSKGNVDLEGSVAAQNLVQVSTANGDVTVGKNAVVGTLGDNSTVILAVGEGEHTQGTLTVDGSIVSYGNVKLSAGEDTPESKAGIWVDGSVSALGQTQLLTQKGTVDVGGTGAIESTSVHMEAQNGGDVSVSGSVTGTDWAQIRTVNGDVTINADASVLGTEVTVKAVENGNVAVKGMVTGVDLVDVSTGNGDITVAKGANVLALGGEVELMAAFGNNYQGNVQIDGSVAASDKLLISTAGGGTGSEGDVAINGDLTGRSVNVFAGSSTVGKGTSGNLVVSGTIEGSDEIYLAAGNGDVTIQKNAQVASSADASVVYLATAFMEGQKGNVHVDGKVVAKGDQANAFVMAGTSGQASGNVLFGSSGNVSANAGAYVVTHNGGVSQVNTGVVVKDGVVASQSLPAALSGETVNLVVQNGSIGGAVGGYLGVSGKVYATADGDISIAAANGGNLKGGPGVGEVSMGRFGSMTFGDPSGSSNIRAGGNLSVYTAGAIESSGTLQANGNVTVSAKEFGDVSYLRAGGKLTINNVGHPKQPQIAYFESVNGKEPKINNLPNDVVIFIDGRLAGGNLNILNKFGADEAFMVDTPELKSTQGIFGNPPFLHSDLDVANPMEVSAIDYLIQEVPRLTLSSDFPAEVDQHVEAAGLSQKDVYWFGQKGDSKEASAEATTDQAKDAGKGPEKPVAQKSAGKN